VSGRRPYDVAASDGVVPVLLAALVVIVPASAAAGQLQRMGCAIIVGTIDIISAILLFIVGVGSLALTPTVGDAAATLWAQLLPSQQSLTYGGRQSALESEMREDMTAIGVASLVGAVRRSCCCSSTSLLFNPQRPLPACSAFWQSLGCSSPCSLASSGLRSGGRS
jgi:hypothetical protein